MSDRRVIDLTTDDLREMLEAVVVKVLGERAAAGEQPTDRELAMPELLKLLDVRTPKTIWRWRRTQGFPAPRKFGNGRVRWRLSEVNAWRASREVSGPGSVARRARGGSAGAAGATP
jgi:predicted DNA-binding transcriptional regulator AlpA